MRASITTQHFLTAFKCCLKWKIFCIPILISKTKKILNWAVFVMKRVKTGIQNAKKDIEKRPDWQICLQKLFSGSLREILSVFVSVWKVLINSQQDDYLGRARGDFGVYLSKLQIRGRPQSGQLRKLRRLIWPNSSQHEKSAGCARLSDQ